MSHASYIVLQIMTNSQISPHGTLCVSMTKPWLVSCSVNYPPGFVVTLSCIDVSRCFLSFFWAYMVTEQESSQALYLCGYHCRRSWTQNVAHTSSAGPLVLLSLTAASDRGQSVCPSVTEVTPWHGFAFTSSTFERNLTLVCIWLAEPSPQSPIWAANSSENTVPGFPTWEEGPMQWKMSSAWVAQSVRHQPLA